MLKYIIGWERMKEKKWWFFMVRTTKNACPQVIVLIGQVTIAQSRGAQYPTSPPSLPSQHTHAQSGSWWAPRTAKVDAGRWDTSNHQDLSRPIERDKCHPLLHLPYSHPDPKLRPTGKGCLPWDHGWSAAPPVDRSHSLTGKDNAKDTKNEKRLNLLGGPRS